LTSKIITDVGSIALDIDFFNGDTILILWKNGLVTGHTTWGQEKFQFQVETNDPLDMVTQNNTVFILTNDRLMRFDISSKDSEIDVWPRVMSVGNISEKTNTTLFIRSETIPNLQIKGEGIKVMSLTAENDGYLARITVDPMNLPSFERTGGEILIEVDGNHEVVPYSFNSYGKVKSFKIFSSELLDLETGELIPFVLSENGEVNPEFDTANGLIITDYISGYIFFLKPTPSKPLE
jgi:hypothetical protein